MQSPETHGEFRAAPKNAVHFLYGAALHRPGEHPWTPVRRFFFLQPVVWGFGLRRLVSNGFLDAKAGFGGFGSRLLVSQSFLGAKAPPDPRTPFLFFATGGLGLWLEAFGKSGFFRCQSGTLFPNSAQAEFGGFGGSHSPKIHNGSIS